MKKKIKISGIIFCMGLIIVLIIYFTIKDSNEIKNLYNEYKLVDKKYKIEGKIDNLLVNKGVCFVTIDSKKILFKTSANFMYDDVYLDMVLEIGDHIKKNSNSDTLIITKNNKEYYFKIGEFINNEY
ncbi:hypothetical protein [Psychroflexus tropicus]|uniref:hypothetical protein n=1 Tax=Psychroflexus tropicus TaxID=197345 RepID=UPI0003696155|nr:hypothetical protein [Psychroflexus tropicus]